MTDRDYRFYVYILASRSRQLYVGMTNNIRGRVARHREGSGSAYTSRYKVHRLVYYEETRYVLNAIARETELKGWRREEKVRLIELHNPTWEDLAAEWFEGLKDATADSLRE